MHGQVQTYREISVLHPLCIGYMMEVRPVFSWPARHPLEHPGGVLALCLPQTYPAQEDTSFDYCSLAMALVWSGFQLNVNCTNHCHCGGESEEQMERKKLFKLCTFLQIYARLHTDNRKICNFCQGKDT